ncbi:MAG: hypothetical protein KJN94_00805 [Gammaproteobacteria bacterium]|nr:hypothetical protein [Gammaproteobacteria bacterium]
MSRSAYDGDELAQIETLNRKLFDAWFETGSDQERRSALRCYLRTMSLLHRRLRMFEVVNHRVFRGRNGLIVPYDAHGALSVYRVQHDGSECIARLRMPNGTLVTDAMIADLAGETGEPVDLERAIYDLDIESLPAVQVTRLRDLADVLMQLNACGSRHEAVYLLRFLVARLCSPSYRGVAKSKNLRPEALNVRNELVAFMNGPFASRLRLPTRILVREVSGLVSQPKRIDEVWQDTIDLAEVHVRGSTICNEIRRSTHHAMGRQTLALAQAYLDWLDSGAGEFPHPEREVPVAVDEEVRGDPRVRALVVRIVANLELLLGSSEIADRLREWQDLYERELLGCGTDDTLDEELESLLERGIRDENRWVAQRRLRNLDAKALGGAWDAGLREDFRTALAALQERVAAEPFDRVTAGSEARSAVAAFRSGLFRDHRDALFARLDHLLTFVGQDEQFEAFRESCSLRQELEALVGDGVFRNQRYLLHQLDCLLEEFGFLALRNVASGYLDSGVDLEQCLRIVFLCAGNLVRDGLYSRELWDLSAMLVIPTRTASELLDVLEQIQRNYHRLVFRVSEAYEVMAEHLGYSEDEMRAVLANFQRTMHDLNSLVHFSDIARAFIAERREQLLGLGSGAGGVDPWDFVHLSHVPDIARRVEDPEAPSLQARYGGKGSGLIHIAYLGIPTRDAFVVPTVLPRMNLHVAAPDRLDQELMRHIAILENDIAASEGGNLRLGDPRNPLLLAVRGGSVFSMPGMLATVVFAGMTQEVAESLALEDEWYAWDSFRRFLASYAAAAWHFDLEELDLVEKAKRRHGVSLKIDLPGAVMREVTEASKAAIREAGHGRELDAVLQDAGLQVRNAVRAVHASWDADRARRYRAIKHLSEGWHTAVIVQQMASGNRSNEEEMRAGMDESRISLTGVIPHTRMASDGVRRFTGDVKFSACGDDLVGGLTAALSFEPVQELQAQAPMLERKLNHIGARLRRYLGSDAEIEFTVERGILSILQTRSAEVEHHHNLRTFVDSGDPDGQGIGICGGAFRGIVAFDELDVEQLRKSPEAAAEGVDGILLVLENPVPDEIPLILSVDGLLASRGGSTSHAAVAVHGIDEKPFSAVLGVAELHVRGSAAEFVDADGTVLHTVHRGDVVSIHGQNGAVFVGRREIRSVQ